MFRISYARIHPNPVILYTLHSKQLLLLLLRHCHAAPSPSPSTKQSFASLLKTYSHPNHLKQIHTLLLTTGFSRKNSLVTQILLSLTLSGEMDYARKLFDEMHKPRVFLWNTLMRGYVKSNLCPRAVEIYPQMHRLGIRPDTFTFPFVLKACAELLAVWAGMEVHALLVKFGLVFDVIVSTELMIMYAKFGDSNSADRIFEGMSNNKDLIAWNALIAVYAQNGHADKALSLFRRMDSFGVNPDSITLVSALSSCAYLGCLELGKQIHQCIEEQMLETNVFVENALLDMYAKCGCMDKASELFGEMHQRNVVSWSTMIGGYAINGDSRRALALYSQMQDEGVQPNYVTLLAVLSACSHSGLVREGKEYFNTMANPRIEHYSSMVDLLGRSGHLDEAYCFIKDMPIEPDAGVWGALLGACTIHRNTKIGQLVADQLFKLAPEVTSYHVLLSNIYAAAERWDDVEKVREMMRGNNVKKVAGYSSIEMNGEVHVFYERSHSHSMDIYKKLDELTDMFRGMGYAPNTDVVLHDVEVEEKEVALRTHSEKLAIAFGLISSSSESPLRIMKNLRVCNDCHAFSKFVSRVVGREIIMRDKNRFHHFKDGECSCRDFW